MELAFEVVSGHFNSKGLVPRLEALKAKTHSLLLDFRVDSVTRFPGGAVELHGTLPSSSQKERVSAVLQVEASSPADPAFPHTERVLAHMPLNEFVCPVLFSGPHVLPASMHARLPAEAREAVQSASTPVRMHLLLRPERSLPAALTGAKLTQRMRWCLDVAAAVAWLWRHGWVLPSLPLSSFGVGSDGRAVLVDVSSAVALCERGVADVPLSAAWLSAALEGHGGAATAIEAAAALGEAADMPLLLAPELEAAVAEARGAGQGSVRVDIRGQSMWALGCALYELLAGQPLRRPASGRDAPDPDALLVRPEALGAASGPWRPAMLALLRTDASRRLARPDFVRVHLIVRLHGPEGDQQVEREMQAALLSAAEAGDASAQNNLGRFLLQLGQSVPCDLADTTDEGLKWCQRAAEQQHAGAMRALAQCYMTGTGVPQSGKRGVDWLSRAADLSDPPALFQMAQLYAEGDGVPEDKAKAARMYSQAADLGSEQAQLALGTMLLFGNGVPVDTARALALLQRAAGQGSSDACHLLAQHWLANKGEPGQAEQAVAWLRRASELGHAVSQLLLGGMYDTGTGVSRDPAQALHWFRKAAEQNVAAAQFNVGVAYEHGEGTGVDLAQATYWFNRAAEQGFAEAQMVMAVRCFNGQGTPLDLPAAVKWMRAAAQQGSAEAQTLLGSCYLEGKGVPKSEKQGVEWLTKAADQSHAEAQYVLGMYFSRSAASADWVQAMRWHARAAQQGHALAQYILGLAHMRNIGVPRSLARGVRWLRRAAHPRSPVCVLARQALREFTGISWELDEEAAGAAGLPDADADAAAVLAGTAAAASAAAAAGDADAGSSGACDDADGALAKMHATAVSMLRRGADAQRATVMLQSAAERGHARAQFDFGVLRIMTGGAQGAKEGAAWVRRAAERDVAEAQFALAELHGQGIGVKSDEKEVVRWLRRAAEQGLASAQFQLYLILRDPSGTPDSHREAARWLEAAAEAGDPQAQGNMGLAFERGWQRPVDMARAREWYGRAAELGHPDAQCRVAAMMLAGEGGAPDVARGFMWMRRAAEQGFVQAQIALGSMLLGSAETREEGKRWMTRAAEAGGRQ